MTTTTLLPDALDEALIVHSLLQCHDDADLQSCGVLDPSEAVSSCTRNAAKLGECCIDSCSSSSSSSAGACTHARYRLSFGLLVKAKAAVLRVGKHNLFLKPRDRAAEAGRLTKLVLHLTCAEDRKWLLQALEPLSVGDDSDESGPSLPALTPVDLLRLSRELTAKTMSLGPGNQKALHALPLRVRVEREALSEDQAPGEDGMEGKEEGEEESRFRLLLPPAFLAELGAFFQSVQRPPGTFAAKDTPDPPSSPSSSPAPDSPTAKPAFSFSHLLPPLVGHGRETCPSCQRRRSLYCGDCLGQRLPQAALLLPPRVPLPFNLVLLLHPAESLDHCTGIHAAVMASPGQLEVLHWPRTRDVPERLHGRELQTEAPHLEQGARGMSGGGGGADASTAAAHYAARWTALLDAIRPTDLLLFPADGATLASDFDWSGAGAGAASCDARPRVIVLEASWNNSKAMHRLLVRGLQQRGVVLRTIMLTDLVGTYWKFHYEGNSAVSTIEAIAHCVGEVRRSLRRGSGDVADQGLENRGEREELEDRAVLDALLVPFEYDRCMLQRRVGQGGKCPRAVQVTGAGVGSWREYL